MVPLLLSVRNVLYLFSWSGLQNSYLLASQRFAVGFGSVAEQCQGRLSGSQLLVLACCSRRLLLASSLCFLPCCHESCYISRYHTHVQKKKRAKEQGRHPYRRSEIFSRNPCYISVVQLCHGPLLVAVELVDQVQCFCLRTLSPQTNWGFIRKKDNGIHTGKAAVCRWCVRW